MWSSTDGEHAEVGQRQLAASQVDLAAAVLASNDGGDLEVDQSGRDQSFAAQSAAGQITIRPIVEKKGGEHARINDQHAQP